MAERYLVSARKYRPRQFDELVAQEHVASTLKNAIRRDRLSHAYLFSGPRGVGKTTAARILAKAINCETPRDERPDNAEPCCACPSCKAFEEGRSLNVFEVDAASNNKVDDIRELREKVRIPPQGSKKKVYILDEVHMLSTQAFNALLKTLEEPPPHALFIFATTEPHKVLPTILSRCQRFDFRRIPVADIVERLQEICTAEDITADDESLMLIARKGEGALRDALSAFDQALSLCGTTLTYEALAQALGVVDRDLYFKATTHAAGQDSAGMLQLVQRVVHEGYDLREFLNGLAEHLRHLLVVETLGPEALTEVAAGARSRYVAAAAPFGEADLLRLLMVASDAEADVKGSPQPRLKLELALLKMAHMQRAADLERALDAIDALETLVDEGELPDTWTAPDRPSASDPTQGTTGASTESSASNSDAASTPPATSTESAPDAGDASDVDEDTEASPTDDPIPGPPTPHAPADPSAARDDESEAAPADPDDEPADAPAQDTTPAADADASDPKPAEDETPTAAPGDEASSGEDGTGADDGADDAPSNRPPSDDTAPPAAGSSPSDRSDDLYNDLFSQPALSPDDETAGEAASGDDAPRDDASSTATAVAEPPAPTARYDADAQARIEKEWPRIVQSATQGHIAVRSVLKNVAPGALSNGVLTLTVEDDLQRRTVREQQQALLTAIAEETDVDVKRLNPEVHTAPADTSAATPDAFLSPIKRLEKLRPTYDALDALFEGFDLESAW
ncbi:DNA polymerase III subunit gamma/tau [Salisaeta longa]|uniref:DNA polymerase III subunit gamma/tau n=1 Tax=Salisaeta longa TaxID=503170 RepID=UPI0003B7492C|nr:DNA polymerase III subunit gamma/tau [Salisaeta longa]